jgi:hypothetical protein
MKWTDEQMEDLRRMVAEGKSWRLIGAHLGRSADAVWVRARKLGLGPKPLKREFKSAIWTLIQRACADRKPRTVHEVSLMVGCARTSVDRLMKRFAKSGQAHVAKWEKREDGGTPIPYWLPFAGKSKRRPKPLGAIEAQRRRRANVREENPERNQAENNRAAMLRAHRTSGIPVQHHVINALFGRAA